MISAIKKNGVIFTPDNLAYFMSEEAFKYCNTKKDEELIIIEPSAGDGALADSILQRANELEYKKVVLYAFDINNDYLNSLKLKIESKYTNVKVICMCCDFVDYAFTNPEIKADIIISNPPYVRTQNMDKKYIEFASGLLKLNGRIDLYHVFICLLKNVLKDNGVISIVVSNKFISNKAGSSLRSYISNNYSIKALYDFGDTKLFNAAVLPAVLIMSKGETTDAEATYASIYSDVSVSNEDYLELFEAISKRDNYAIKDDQLYKISYGTLSITNNNWSMKSDKIDQFLELVEMNTAYYFSDFAKIKVGIKTTADKVFISDNWDKYGTDTPELLRPLITHRVAGQYFSNLKDSFQVLYPYQMIDGKKKVIDLNDYPKTKRYLESNYEILSSRKYIQESNKEWFEIWVPHSPEQWQKEKIVFRDISEHPQFWLAKSGEVVNGDCYWFDFKDNISDEIIFLILAIANSTFIEKYYDLKFNNKLYSGRRRFMSQYVEKFPIFSLEKPEAKEIIVIMKKAMISSSLTNEEIMTLNKLVDSGFTRKN